MNSLPSRISHSSILRRAAALLAVLAWSSLAFCGEIHDAAKTGDLDKVKALLKENPDLVVSKGINGATPLHEAAVNGKKAIVEFLIDSKADVNAKDNEGATPLHCAARVGNMDAARLLLANKADVNAKMNNGATPLHLAATRGLTLTAELLVAKGADVNAKDKDGNTPLRWAANNGHKDIQELPRAKGAENAGPTSSVFVPLGELNKVNPLIIGLNTDGSFKLDKPLALDRPLEKDGYFKASEWVMPNGEHWVCAEYSDPQNLTWNRSSWAKLDIKPYPDYGSIATAINVTNGFIVKVPKGNLPITNSEQSMLTSVSVGDILFSGDTYDIRVVAGADKTTPDGRNEDERVSFYFTKHYGAYLKDKQNGLNPPLPSGGGQFWDERAAFRDAGHDANVVTQGGNTAPPPRIEIEGVIDKDQRMPEPRIIASELPSEGKAGFEERVLWHCHRLFFDWAETGDTVRVAFWKLTGSFAPRYSRSGGKDSDLVFNTAEKDLNAFIPGTAVTPWKQVGDTRDGKLVQLDIAIQYEIIGIVLPKNQICIVEAQSKDSRAPKTGAYSVHNGVATLESFLPFPVDKATDIRTVEVQSKASPPPKGKATTTADSATPADKPQ